MLPSKLAKPTVYACDLQEHILNDPVSPTEDNPLYDPQNVVETFGEDLINSVAEPLAANEDLVQIAGRWFPQALLVDINIGYLNMAEALLEMEEGGPLPTESYLGAN